MCMYVTVTMHAPAQQWTRECMIRQWSTKFIIFLFHTPLSLLQWSCRHPLAETRAWTSRRNGCGGDHYKPLNLKWENWQIHPRSRGNWSVYLCACQRLFYHQKISFSNRTTARERYIYIYVCHAMVYIYVCVCVCWWYPLESKTRALTIYTTRIGFPYWQDQ